MCVAEAKQVKRLGGAARDRMLEGGRTVDVSRVGSPGGCSGSGSRVSEACRMRPRCGGVVGGADELLQRRMVGGVLHAVDDAGGARHVGGEGGQRATQPGGVLAVCTAGGMRCDGRAAWRAGGYGAGAGLKRRASGRGRGRGRG